MVLSVYTDASYCQQNKVAACGYCILHKGVLILHNVELHHNISTSTQAEVIAVSRGLQEAFLVNGVKSISANTDCLTIIYSQKNPKKTTEEHKELAAVIEIIKEHKVGVQLNFVRSHNGHTYNEFIDKTCKHILRSHLKNKPI